MNNDDNPSIEERISDLRVRIKRAEKIEEQAEIIESLVALGHAAEPLLEDVKQKIREWQYIRVDSLARLIMNLKSESLLRAAKEAGIKFAARNEALLLRAGFAEFERPLVDHLWNERENSFDLCFGSAIGAISECARLPETLETLIVLEKDLARRHGECHTKAEYEKMLIERGEMDREEMSDEVFDEQNLYSHLKTLRDTIAKLKSRDLAGEVLSHIAPEEIEASVPPEGICDMILRGENDKLEFKATLRWCLRSNDVKNEVQNAVVKTIAAFANSEGGYLLIGVQDDGNPIGLNLDYTSSENIQDRDGFEQHLRNVLNQKMGKVGLVLSVKVSFPEFLGIEICCVEVKPVQIPVFVDRKIFFIRDGNRTLELDPEDTSKYIRNRFP
jgi:hypothetical protein